MLQKLDQIQKENTSNMNIQWTKDDMDQINKHHSNNYMIPIFEDILQKNNVNSILDIGCGNGHFTSYFKNKVAKISGVDGSLYGLKEAVKVGFTDCYQVDNIDYEDISKIEGKFDLIICKDFLEHILFPKKLIENSLKLLAPNGSILILVPNHFTLYHRLKFLFTNNVDTQNYFPDSSEWDFPHIRFFTHKGLTSLCSSLGLSLECDYSDRFYYFLPRLTRITKALGMAKPLMNRYPSQFSTCFALLLKNKH